MGKTLAARVAAGIWGAASIKGGVFRDWRGTANAMELATEDCSDGFLVLDEIHQAETRDVVGSIYMLGNESGKGRTRRDITSARRKVWRIFPLSTGETDVAAMAAKAGTPLPAGADIRLLSLPVDTATTWPNLYGEPDARALMGRLNAALRRQYGTAGPLFLDDAAEVGPLLDQVTGSVTSFTGDGAYDQDRVYTELFQRYPDAAVVVPPRVTAVPSETAETAPTQRDRHLQMIARHGRLAWQKQSGCAKRARAEAAMGRWTAGNRRWLARGRTRVGPPRWPSLSMRSTACRSWTPELCPHPLIRDGIRGTLRLLPRSVHHARS